MRTLNNSVEDIVEACGRETADELSEPVVQESGFFSFIGSLFGVVYDAVVTIVETAIELAGRAGVLVNSAAVAFIAAMGIDFGVGMASGANGSVLAFVADPMSLFLMFVFVTAVSVFFVNVNAEDSVVRQ